MLTILSCVLDGLRPFNQRFAPCGVLYRASHLTDFGGSVARTPQGAIEGRDYSDCQDEHAVKDEKERRMD